MESTMTLALASSLGLATPAELSLLLWSVLLVVATVQVRGYLALARRAREREAFYRGEQVR